MMMVKRLLLRVGSPTEIKNKKKYSKGNHKETSEFLNDVKRERVLNEEDGVCRYTVFCRLYQNCEDT